MGKLLSKVEACDINNPEDFILADAMAMSKDRVKETKER